MQSIFYAKLSAKGYKHMHTYESFDYNAQETKVILLVCIFFKWNEGLNPLETFSKIISVSIVYGQFKTID